MYLNSYSKELVNELLMMRYAINDKCEGSLIISRKLKIYEQSMGGGNYTQVPTILLKGK